MHERPLEAQSAKDSAADDALRGVVIGASVTSEKLPLNPESPENPKGSLDGPASPFLAKNLEDFGVTAVQLSEVEVPVVFGPGEVRLRQGVMEVTVPPKFREKPSRGSMGFVPGQRWTKDNYPANPPRGRVNRAAFTFTNLCRKYGAEIDPDYPDRTRLESLVVQVWNAAFDGDTKALKEILARVDPAVRKVAVEGVAADLGNAMLRRMLDAGAFPMREGFELPQIEVVQIQETSDGQDGA